MNDEMKYGIIQFFTNNPERFGRFCANLLEGYSYSWGDYKLNNKEAIEIYQIMQEKFLDKKG